MIRPARRTLLAALLALAGAIGLRAPKALCQDDLDQVQDSQPEPDDLSTLKIFNQVVLLVKDNYVDPRRIHPKEMMAAALDYVQRTVADVMVDEGPKVDGKAEPDHVKITVGTATKDFDISDVDTLWKLSFRLKDIFSFMQSHLSKNDKTKDIEYAAVAGMLSTLDPHSVFLQPESFKEMRLQTRGEFGGLGFVISMKDGQLTVVKVLKDTPAYRSGIKSKDKVTKIEEQSTVNMDLNDAVSKLRGKPGSKIAITVARASWPQPRKLVLTREQIQIESVTYKLLESDLPPPGDAKGQDGKAAKSYVGGIKIKNFQGNTSRDLLKALADLKAQAQAKGGKLGGVVLDLRGDPGGLLEQAIQVTNAFVDHGTIVTTVGLSDKLREVKKAHAGPDVERDMPLAVLVDNGSASASEIVSGALKNLNRAVIVGRPTFGKGSVQVLYDFPDDTALKLTIAQYLTPGDLSIQEVGIVPDIELDAARVSKDLVQVFAPHKLVGEADLEHHFGNPADLKPVEKRSDVVVKEKPSLVVEYLREQKKPKQDAAGQDRPDLPDEDDMDDAEDEDDFQVDFQVKFARDLVLSAPANSRDGMLAQAHGYVDHVRQLQQAKIDQAIQALGVDWASGADTGDAHAVVDLKESPARGEAGQTLNLVATVKNDGTGPLHQLRAYTESDNPWLDRREFLFGLVGPGETRSWTVPVKLPKDMISRRDEVTVKFQEEHDRAPADRKTEVATAQLPRPAFAFSWQAMAPHGPQDGMAHVGQDLVVTVDVKNEGVGKSLSSFASLKDLGDEKIFIKKGRAKLGELKPGETRTVQFELELHEGYAGGSLPLRLAIVDDQLDEYVTDKLTVAVAPATLHYSPARADIRVDGPGVLLAAAAADALPIATVKKGAILQAIGRAGAFWAVSWAKDRVGFLPTKDGREAHGHPAATAQELMQHEPPHILIAGLDPSLGGPVTDGDHFQVDGSVADAKPLRDMYIFVNDKKVYFEAAQPKTDKLEFQKSVPLKAGDNVVTIVAREDDEYSSKRSFVILRRADAVTAKAERTQNP
ncbi:MAG: MXAN_5808 family serine peptidase [Deltaproteobacteria bacterium]